MQLKCSECRLTFVNTTLLALHNCEKLTFKCLTCTRHPGFKTKALLDAHKADAHPDDDEDAGSGAVGTLKLSLFVNDCSAKQKKRDIVLMDTLRRHHLINPTHKNNTKAKPEEKAEMHLQPCIEELYHKETGLLRDYPKPDLAAFNPRLSKMRTRMLDLYFERGLDKIVAPTAERDATLKCIMETLCTDRLQVFAATRAKRNNDEGGEGGSKKKAKIDKKAEAEAEAKIMELGRVVLERNNIEKLLKGENELYLVTTGAGSKADVKKSISSLQKRLEAAKKKMEELGEA